MDQSTKTTNELYGRLKVTIPKSTIDKMVELIDESDKLNVEIGATLIIDAKNNIDLVNSERGDARGVQNDDSIKKSIMDCEDNQRVIGRFHTHSLDSALPSCSDIENVIFEHAYHISCIGSNYLEFRSDNAQKRQHIRCFSAKCLPISALRECKIPNSEMLDEQIYCEYFTEFNEYFDSCIIYTDSIDGDVTYEMENRVIQTIMKNHYVDVEESIEYATRQQQQCSV